MTGRARVTRHGMNHAPGGSDPIPGSSGGGIQFDTYPQSGDWLYVESTGGETSSPSAGTGILLQDTSAFASGGVGIALDSTNGDITIDTHGTNRNITLTAHDGEMDLWARGSGGLTITSDNALVLSGNPTEIESASGDLTLATANNRIVQVTKGIGGSQHSWFANYGGAERFAMLDNSGNFIFRIDDDGSIHTKSGVTTLTDDL